MSRDIVGRVAWLVRDLRDRSELEEIGKDSEETQRWLSMISSVLEIGPALYSHTHLRRHKNGRQWPSLIITDSGEMIRLLDRMQNPRV